MEVQSEPNRNRNRNRGDDEEARRFVNDDQLNQYSQPCGRRDLRVEIVNYYKRFYEYDDLSPDDNVTVTLGATEALASALRKIGRAHV